MKLVQRISPLFVEDGAIQANWMLQGSAVFTTIDVVCTILPTLALAAVPVGRFARLAGCGRTWKQ